jgi:putative DNA primase/helicase
MTSEFIPAELKPLSRWVVAKSEVAKGRRTKVPYCPDDPTRKASSTDPATWSDFETALRLVESGGFPMLGFQLDGSGYVGIDFDHCVEDGVVASWALDYIRALDSYTEISVSGTRT